MHVKDEKSRQKKIIFLVAFLVLIRPITSQRNLQRKSWHNTLHSKSWCSYINLIASINWMTEHTQWVKLFSYYLINYQDIEHAFINRLQGSSALCLGWVLVVVQDEHYMSTQHTFHSGTNILIQLLQLHASLSTT